MSRWGPRNNHTPPPPASVLPAAAAAAAAVATTNKAAAAAAAANSLDDFELLTEVAWGPSRDDPDYDTDQELAPKPHRRHVDVCSCVRPADPSVVKCLDLSCILFCTNEECTSKCPAGPACGNRRIQRGAFAAQLAIIDAGPKGRGLQTLNALQKGDLICEYTGRAVMGKHLNRLFRRYQFDRRLYILALGNDIYLDARTSGGLARFINHSCEPNCKMERWKVKGILRAAVVALRDIAAGEELSFDYQWERKRGRAPTLCHCGSRKCRGTLEVELSDDEEEEEIQGHWERWKVADQTLVNRVVQVHNRQGKTANGEDDDDQQYEIGEVTGYNGREHCILYKHTAKEVWEDLSRKDWMVLDDKVDKEFFIAKKMHPGGPQPSSSLLSAAEQQTMPTKNYLYVQTPIKQAFWSKHIVERCERNCDVRITAQQMSRPPWDANPNDPEEVEKFQALDQSQDARVWKITITGTDVAKAQEILTKNLLYLEKRLLGEDPTTGGNLTPPPPTAAGATSTPANEHEVIVPRLIVEIVKRRLPALREKCRCVQINFAPSESISKQFSRLLLEGTLLSDIQAAKDHLWKFLINICIEMQAPRVNNVAIAMAPSQQGPLFRHLAFLGGTLTANQFVLLCHGPKNRLRTDAEEDLNSSPFLRSFEDMYGCTVWIQAEEDRGRIDSKNQMVALATPHTPRKVFFGCPPSEVPKFFDLIQSRARELESGVKYFYLGPDRIFQPLMMGGRFFDFVRDVTGASVNVDSMTGHYLHIDGKGIPANPAVTQLSEGDRASLAEEVIRLQIECYRDRVTRESPWIFGRDWTMTALPKVETEGSPRVLGYLDVVSASQGGSDVADIIGHLGLPPSVGGHAMTILYRFVSVKKETLIKLRDAILACVFVANKAHKLSKQKGLELVLEAGYKTFYSGAAFDPSKEEAAVLEEKVLAAEKEILETLQYDVFWRGVEWIRAAAVNAGKMKETRVEEIFSFAFSGQVLSCGPELWLKYGTEYVFAAGAAFLKRDLDKLLPVLNLIPLKVDQAAKLIVETAKFSTPPSKQATSHAMLEKGRMTLERHLDRISKECAIAMTKHPIAGELTASAQHPGLQQARQRRSLEAQPAQLVHERLSPILDGITAESGASIFVSSGATPELRDVVMEGHWKAVAIAEHLAQEALGGEPMDQDSVDCSLVREDLRSLQAKTRAGLVNAGDIRVSDGWDGAVQPCSTTTETSNCRKLGGKSCVAGTVSGRSLREAGLRWLTYQHRGFSATGSLDDMDAVRSHGPDQIEVLASLVSSVVGTLNDFPILKSISETAVSSEKPSEVIPVSLQRWPPEKVAVKENGPKNNAMRTGFSPSALQEMQLLTQLHLAVPTPRGHPNLILPVGIALPQENDTECTDSADSKVEKEQSPYDDPMVFSLFRSSEENDRAAESEKKVKTSPHIVHQPTPFILQRFMSSRIRELDETGISPTILMSWCHDLLSAVAHCHSNHMVLRRVLPDLIVVDHAGVIQLGGFYHCRVLSSGAGTEELGSIFSKLTDSSKSRKKQLEAESDPLAAPEKLLGCPIHLQASDMWSVGCLLASLMLNRPLFKANRKCPLLLAQFKVIGLPGEGNFREGAESPLYSKPTRVYRRAVKHALKHMLEDRFPVQANMVADYDNLIGLISKLLHLDPRKRYTAEEALKHEAMKDYMEKCNTMSFRKQYASDWLSLKRRMMVLEGEERSMERKKKRTAMIAAASSGTGIQRGEDDDLYDMDDLLEITKKSKTTLA